jgi:hypothetical protein
MSQMIRILKSTDSESRQRQVARLKHKIAYLTEEIQLIEMTLDTPKTRKHRILDQ